MTTVFLFRWSAIFGILFLWTALAPCHFPVLTLEQNEISLGTAAIIRLRYGHPFESEWENCPKPLSLMAHTPEGKIVPLTLQKIETKMGDNTIDQFQAQYVPTIRGDHKIVATLAPKKTPGAQTPVQEIAATWLHIQQEKGWDKRVDGWTAMTRPYGILPGMVFQARLPKPATFEFELLNENPPNPLPKPSLITFTGNTDDRGIATLSLPKAGWWGLAAGQDSLDPTGKPLRLLHVLWLKLDALDK